MNVVDALVPLPVTPEGITREDVIQAIADFDGGVSHEFVPSTGYDLVFNGKR